MRKYFRSVQDVLENYLKKKVKIKKSIGYFVDILM